MRLDEIKSGKVLEGPELISRLAELVERTPNPALSVEIDLEKDRPELRMQTGIVIREEELESDETPKPKLGKLNASEEELKELLKARGMPWNEDFLGRDITYWGSDERVDSMGDIVRQDWIFDEFNRNSPMPFSHQWSGLPIGRHIDWEVRDRKEKGRKGYKGPALWIRGLFATAEMSSFAEEVFQLVRSRILVGGSVGFWSGKVIDIEDPDERKKLGLGPWGLVFEKNHLLEFSPTTLPANDGAVAIAERLAESKERGTLIIPGAIHCLREMKRRVSLKAEDPEKDWDEFDSIIRDTAQLLFPEDDWEKIAIDDFVLEEFREIESQIQDKKEAPTESVEVKVSAEPEFVSAMKELAESNKSILGEINTLEVKLTDLLGEVNISLKEIREFLEALKDQERDKEEPGDETGEPIPQSTSIDLSRLKGLVDSLERKLKPAS